MRHRIKKWMYVIIFCFAVLRPLQPVQAAGAIGNINQFDSLSGDAKYLGSQYREHYYLDMEETGLLDVGYKMLNSISNVLFSFIRWLAYLTVTIFYICFNLNLADLFGTQINQIQAALNNSIFQPLFLLGCGAAFCILAVRFVKQDLAGVVSQLAKIIGIVMLSILAVTQSGTVLSYCTNITKEISVNMLSGVNAATGLSQNINDFAAQGAGVLWQNLIHEPWLTMEFGSNPVSAQDIELFLTTEPSSEERDTLIETHDWECFGMKRAGEKIGFMILYLIPFLMKCGIYIIIALIQLVFQLLAIFYVFMAPLILILSLFPGYERMLGLWLRKILESQISILVITMIIGVLVKLDQILFEWARTANYGWMIALVIQVALALALFYNRDKLLSVMSNVQRGVSTPGFAANRFKMMGNIYQNAIPNTIRYSERLGKKMGSSIKEAAVGANRFAHSIEDKKITLQGHSGKEQNTKEGEGWWYWPHYEDYQETKKEQNPQLKGSVRKALPESKDSLPLPVPSTLPHLPILDTQFPAFSERKILLPAFTQEEKEREEIVQQNVLGLDRDRSHKKQAILSEETKLSENFKQENKKTEDREPANKLLRPILMSTQAESLQEIPKEKELPPIKINLTLKDGTGKNTEVSSKLEAHKSMHILIPEKEVSPKLEEKTLEKQISAPIYDKNMDTLKKPSLNSGRNLNSAQTKNKNTESIRKQSEFFTESAGIPLSFHDEPPFVKLSSTSIEKEELSKEKEPETRKESERRKEPEKRKESEQNQRVYKVLEASTGKESTRTKEEQLKVPTNQVSVYQNTISLERNPNKNPNLQTEEPEKAIKSDPGQSNANAVPQEIIRSESPSQTGKRTKSTERATKDSENHMLEHQHKNLLGRNLSSEETVSSNTEKAGIMYETLSPSSEEIKTEQGKQELEKLTTTMPQEKKNCRNQEIKEKHKQQEFPSKMSDNLQRSPELSSLVTVQPMATTCQKQSGGKRLEKQNKLSQPYSAKVRNNIQKEQAKEVISQREKEQSIVEEPKQKGEGEGRIEKNAMDLPIPNTKEKLEKWEEADNRSYIQTESEWNIMQKPDYLLSNPKIPFEETILADQQETKRVTKRRKQTEEKKTMIPQDHKRIGRDVIKEKNVQFDNRTSLEKEPELLLPSQSFSSVMPNYLNSTIQPEKYVESGKSKTVPIEIKQNKREVEIVQDKFLEKERLINDLKQTKLESAIISGHNQEKKKAEERIIYSQEKVVVSKPMRKKACVIKNSKYSAAINPFSSRKSP